MSLHAVQRERQVVHYESFSPPHQSDMVHIGNVGIPLLAAAVLLTLYEKQELTWLALPCQKFLFSEMKTIHSESP
jgi:hypothetical protein